MVSVYGLDATMRVVGEPREYAATVGNSPSLFQVLQFTTGTFPATGMNK